MAGGDIAVMWGDEVFLYLEYLKRVVPDTHKVFLGETVRFRCYGNTTMRWTFNGQQLPSNAELSKSELGSQRSVLYITRVRLENSGIYTCYGLDEYSKPFEENGKLIVYGKYSSQGGKMRMIVYIVKVLVLQLDHITSIF